MVQSNAWPLNTVLYVKDFFGNSPYVVFYTLKNMGLENFNSGAGVPTLNRNHLTGIQMAVSNKNLQGQFEAIVSPIHSRIEQIQTSNSMLVRVRETLLPRLLSGRLSVADLDIQLPPVMAEEVNGKEVGAAHA
jgi:type I restriction enzyme S subunit